MKNIIIVLLILISVTSAYAQSSNDKARAYFIEAKSSYESGSYSNVIERLEATEKLLGSTNPVILNLKVKTYYALGQYQKAQQSLDEFSRKSGNADADLKNETLSYFVKVEDAIKEDADRKERARLAEIKRKEDTRLAENKKDEENRRDYEKQRIKYKQYYDNYVVKQDSYSLKEVTPHYLVPYYNEGGLVDYFQGFYVDKNGDVVIDLKNGEYSQYDKAKGFSEGISVIEKRDTRNWGIEFINEKGEVVFETKDLIASYVSRDRFNKGLMPMQTKGEIGRRSGYVNKKGDIVIAFIYGSAGDFNSEGFAKVMLFDNPKKEKGEKYGIINVRGETVVPIKYSDIKPFSNGYAAVKIYGKGWGLMNLKGEEVVACQYSQMKGSFKNGKIQVNKKSKDKGWFYINAKGEVVD